MGETTVLETRQVLTPEVIMDKGALGKEYEAGTIIVKQGDSGDCMYVVQEGQVVATMEKDGQ